MSSSLCVVGWRTGLLVLDPGAGGNNCLICCVRIVLIMVFLLECVMGSFPLFMEDLFSWGTMVGGVVHAFAVLLVAIVGVFLKYFLLVLYMIILLVFS